VSPSQSDLRVAHSGLEGVGPRSGTGYRRYGDEDLGRLQRIMFYRELGFALEDITDLVNDPGADSAEHLRRQHRLLAARTRRSEPRPLAGPTGRLTRGMSGTQGFPGFQRPSLVYRGAGLPDN
jgi:hypothetical protein